PWPADNSGRVLGGHHEDSGFNSGKRTFKIYVPKVDINGDYNRDGNPVDHASEADAVTFDGPKGMVILANTDDDVNDQTKQPDCADGVINGANDLADIYTLKLAKLGIAAGDIPSGMTLELSVENPSGEPSGAPTAKDRVRIFRSKAQDAQGVVGPDPLTDKVVFKKSPGSSDMDIDLLGGTGDLEMGIEGIEYGRQVIVKLVLKLNGQELGNDTIRLLVSPFLVLANTDKATKAYVANAFGWQDFYDDTAAALNGVVTVVEYGADFTQDYAEIGATRSAPGQAERKLCTIAGFFGTRYDDQVASDTGYFHIEAGNPGGNVEAAPPIQGYSYGRLIVGSTLQGNIKAFLQAQKVQTDNGNMIELPVGWLQVGHIDEVMSIVPVGSGFRVLVADLQLAIDLLRNNPNEETWGGFDTRAQLLAAYDDPNNAAKITLINNNLASIRTALAQGLGINTTDLIKVPVAFEMDASGSIGTKLPNMVNMIDVKPQSGALNLVVPRPYFVPFATSLGDSLTAAGCSGTVTFVDTTGPHGAGGEAHCASNVRRELP
ncbi:MAG: protein-arginine deiminase family protein, partial [Verrucomicrobiota bacterium]|nr:protein-arginine deiminase family protein [Verrucomicrobiota bacterium]